MIEPVSSPGRRRGHPAQVGNLAANRCAGDCQQLAAAVVRLDEHADRVAAVFRAQHAGRRADAALEPVADHPGAAADIAFGHRTAARPIQRLERMGLRDVESVDVVQEPVPRLGDDGKAEVAGIAFASAALHVPLDDRVAHDADAVRVGDENRGAQEARFLDPGRAGHLAVAVEGVPPREHTVAERAALRQDGGDAGAHRSLAAHQRALAGDERRVADLDAGDIGDRVEGSWGAVERHARDHARGVSAVRASPSNRPPT